MVRTPAATGPGGGLFPPRQRLCTVSARRFRWPVRLETMLGAALFYLLLFLSLVVVPAAAIALLLAFVQHQRRFWRRMAPRFQPFGRWFGSRPVIDRLQERHPRLLAFVGARFDPR